MTIQFQPDSNDIFPENLILPPNRNTMLQCSKDGTLRNSEEDVESRITYFDTPGKENTDAVLQIVKKRAEELGIRKVVVASYRGYTALRAVEILKGFQIIVISGFRDITAENINQGIPEADKKFIDSHGGIVYVATHLFSGINRAMSKKFNTFMLGDIVAACMRTMSTGIKVAVECTVAAADAGLVRTDEDVIAIGGTRSGADSAITLRPVVSADFFDLKIKEILCKPYH